MLLTALVIATALFPGAGTGLDTARRQVAEFGSRMILAPTTPEATPLFVAEARAVSNWRVEAGLSLRPASLALVARYAVVEPGFVARCVRLNNYWCIKRAGWNGEIGADAEGHTGFVSAASGADAAAQLLRRYYRDLNRRSALAIVRRWAPAECRLPGAVSARKGQLLAQTSQVSTDIAPLGLRKTLRARYLARRGPAAGGPRRVMAVSSNPLRVQPWSARALLARSGKGVPSPRVRMAGGSPETVADTAPPAPKQGLLIRPSVILAKPSVLIVRPSELLVKPSPARRIATAPTAKPSARAAPRLALADRLAAESTALPSIVAGLPNIPLLDLQVPAPLCADDETRIRNYATRIAAGVGLKVDDDLLLFDQEGRPQPNLAPVMLAMSAVELGTLRAGPALVEAAIGRLAPGIAKVTPSAGP